MRLFKQIFNRTRNTALFLKCLAICTIASGSSLGASTLGSLTLDATDISAAGADFPSPILIDGYYTMNITDTIAGRDFDVTVSVDTTSMPGTGSASFQARATTAGTTSSQSSFTTLSGTPVTFYSQTSMSASPYALNIEVQLLDASVEDFTEGSYSAVFTFTYSETWT